MGKVYRAGVGQRLVNVVFRRLAAWGQGPKYLHILTVTGRTSGRERSVPIDVMDMNGLRYLVAPYGQVNWVRNLRSAGTASLRRGTEVHSYDAVEMDPSQAIPVIREYVRTVPVTRAYWNATADATDDDVLEDALKHPVFALTVHPGSR